MTDVTVITDIDVQGEVLPEWDAVLSDEALGFVALLHKEFNERRLELLAAREERKARLDAGELPDFLPETREIREREWTVAPIPPDLQDRRVEITGPVDRKMIINALNSGANVFMADFEDANSPTWENNIQGQLNLIDAVRRTIVFESGEKQYKLNDKTAVLLVRPRGWHLDEKHVFIDGQPVSASLFDFALYFFHNAQELIARGTGPYFYLPKMESHLEARLWNDVFVLAQQFLGIPVGTIRATVLIETILASFEMHEILWELRDHSAGLNCGRWDYIFSFIKKFRARHDFITPDRGSITMDKAFLAAYVDLLIQTCHKRGIHAMGGMAAQIPIKGDDAANEAAFAKVRADKLREVQAGHDGTWVAHPGMVALAKEVFDAYMPGANQIDRKRDDVDIRREDLLRLPEGVITLAGLRQNINVGIQYLAAWLGGSGAVPLYNLMEDAATAEISRTQLWQWIQHGARLDDGTLIGAELYRSIRDVELARIGGHQPHIQTAARLFDELILTSELADFLTNPRISGATGAQAVIGVITMVETFTIDPPPFPEVIPMPIVMPPGRYQSGDWIHEYEIEAFVDDHEFGEIDDARDRHGNRVQIKLYFAFAQGDAREAVQAELDACGLHHPNILPVLRFGPAANQFYFVMPFCEYRTLADWLRTRRAFRRQDAFRILHQLAFALSYLHDHGIVHCALNPAAIVVANANPLVQIGDFAHARFDRCQLRSRRWASTSPFAAPELSRESVSAAPSLDVFSIAMITFAVLTGGSPSRHDTGEWDLRLIEEYVPEFAPLLALMLSNDPSRRPAASAVMRFVEPLLGTNLSIPPRETQFTK